MLRFWHQILQALCDVIVKLDSKKCVALPAAVPRSAETTAVPTKRGVKSPEVDGANPRQDAFFEPLAQHPELRFTDGMGPFFRSSSAGVLGYLGSRDV